MSQGTVSSIPPRDTLPGKRKTAMGPHEVGVQPEVGLGAGILLGLLAGRDRILRRPTILSAILGAALVLVGAAIERRVGTSGAVDRTLFSTFRIVIPLVSFGVAAEAAGRTNLRDGVWPIARYGVARRDVAFGAILAAALASAALAAIFAVASVVLAHAPSAPPLVHDAFQSAWIAALTASAYVAWFSFGATFAKGGRGRWIPLLADFLVGGGAGLFGAILPRGNAQNLLGGAAPLHLTQPASSGILLVSATALAILAALRCHR